MRASDEMGQEGKRGDVLKAEAGWLTALSGVLLCSKIFLLS